MGTGGYRRREHGHGHGQGGCGAAAVSARRYSVPEAVMRRCSLRSSDQSGASGASASSSGGERSPDRAPAPANPDDLEDREDTDPGQGRTRANRKADPLCRAKRKHGVDANHNETIETRSAKGVLLVRSTQCSTASSFRSDWTAVSAASTVSTTTTCSSCQHALGHALERAMMAAGSPPTSRTSTSTATATTVTSALDAAADPAPAEAPTAVPAADRLCIHCGGQASGSKPCTPRERLEALQAGQHGPPAERVAAQAGAGTREERVREKTLAGDAKRTKDAAKAAAAAEASTAARDAVKEVHSTSKTRTRVEGGRTTIIKPHCRLKDVPDEDAHPYVKMNGSPDLVSGSEGTSTSFNMSLADLSTREDSRSPTPTPTPTPSPTTFRSRRPSSDRLSTPESLRSGPITEAMGGLNSGSSSTSPDRSMRLTGATPGESSPGTPPQQRQPPPPAPRFASAEASSAESRTPTPPPPPTRQPNRPHRKFDDKVHVVSETSSFIILDELNNTDAGDGEEDDKYSDHSDFNSHTGRTVRAQHQQHQQHLQKPQARRSHWARQSGKVNESFEVLDDVPVPEDVHCKACRRRGEQATEVKESKKMASETRRVHRTQQREKKRDQRKAEAEAMERDSLSGSVPDMFGVDEEGNVLFCESGVDSRRPSQAGLADKTLPLAQPQPQQLPLQTKSQPPAPAAAHADDHAPQALQASRAARTRKASDRSAATLRPEPGGTKSTKECCHVDQDQDQDFGETMRCDHHSEEQTFFCGVKEVYSVTTEKVEKWGSESREWLEKTTSHRIQHQHPHGPDRQQQQQQRQYNLSNRINIANNNPILIASEILEIPPDQRIRPGAFGQSVVRAAAADGDLSLPSIRTGGQGRDQDREPFRGRDQSEHHQQQGDDAGSTAAAAHVRFMDDACGYAAPRTRTIVSDLVGTEPAEVQVAVPRYPAVPRSRSMVVNMSSGEEDEGGDDSGSECLSCADSLESEQSPRTARGEARGHDDKPVRGHVVAPEAAAPRHVRVQSPKTFFVSLSEEQTEEDVPVSARLPDVLRDRLMHRHTMVKLQMAQSRRCLRTVCDAVPVRRGDARRRGRRGPTLRVGLTQGREEDDKQATKLTVRVEHRPEASPRRERDEKSVPARKERPRPSKKEVAPVVRVHKCHVDDEVKTSFKAKPYKGSRTTEAAEKLEEGKQAEQPRRVRTQRAQQDAKAGHRASVRSKDRSAQDKLNGSKGRSQRSLEPRTAPRATHQSENTDRARAHQRQKQRDVHTSGRAENKSTTRTHVTHKNVINVARSNGKATAETKSELISELARVRDAYEELQRAHVNISQTHEDVTTKASQEAVSVATKTKVKHRTDEETGGLQTRVDQKASVDAEGVDVSVAARTKVSQPHAPEDKSDAHDGPRPADGGAGAEAHAGAHAQTQTTPRVGGGDGLQHPPPTAPTTTTRAAAETRSHSSTESHSTTETCSATRRVMSRSHPERSREDPDAGAEGPADPESTRTTVQTSVRTSLQPQGDGGNCGLSGASAPSLADTSNCLLHNLLQLGSAMENAEIRQKVVEIQTTIQRNVVHQNIVETETTVEKSSSIGGGRPGRPGSPGTPRTATQQEDGGSARPPGVRPAVSKALPASPGPAPRPSRSATGQRFQQKFEAIPEESRNGGEQDDNRADQAHSSSKARAALQQHVEDEAKGWINFCLMKENAEHEDGDGEHAEGGPAEAGATPTPRGPVSAATSPIVLEPEPPEPPGPPGPPGPTLTVQTVHTATSPIPSARFRCVDAAVCTDNAPASSAGRGDNGAAAANPPPKADERPGPDRHQKAAPPGKASAGPPRAAVSRTTISASTKSDARVEARTETTTDRRVEAKAYRAQGVGTTDQEDAATNTTCGPVPNGPTCARTSRDAAGDTAAPAAGCRGCESPCDPPTSTCSCEPPPRRAPVDASTSTMCGPVLPLDEIRGPRDASTSTLCGPAPPPPPRQPDAGSVCGPVSCSTPPDTGGGLMTMPPLDLGSLGVPFSEAAVAACTHQSTTMMSMSSCRRTVVTRKHRIRVPDLSDALSTSSDSTEYMAPPGRSITDGDSTCSPCWRPGAPGARGAGVRGPRGRPRGSQGATPGLYQHHVPPRAQPAGPPPRDGVGWTVTVAGAGANQQGDLEMRLSFPAEDAKDAKDKDGLEGGRGCGRSQTANVSGPGQAGRWSLTIRNQLPAGDGQASQRGVSVSMVPSTPQENRQTDNKRAARAARAATSDKPGSRRPLSLIWPRLHQEINSVAAHEASEAETVLSVTGAAIQRRSHPRHHGHRR